MSTTTNTTIQLHQIYYQVEQLASLDPDMQPYDNCQNLNPEWCEYHIFRSEYLAKHIQPDTLTGFVSWKFSAKTGLSGRDFKAFIEDHPGFDLYVINPFPLEALKYQNIWQQGSKSHRHLLELTQQVMQRLPESSPLSGLNLQTLHMHHQEVAYCNYWVGNSSFWDAYMTLCEPLYQEFTQRLTPSEQAIFKRRATRHNDTRYAPYIMERVLSTLITLNRQGKLPTQLKVCQYPWTATEISSRLTHASPEDIQRILDLRNEYEQAPTAYRLNLLYHLVKKLQQDRQAIRKALNWITQEFHRDDAPTTAPHWLTKWRLYTRLSRD